MMVIELLHRHRSVNDNFTSLSNYILCSNLMPTDDDEPRSTSGRPTLRSRGKCTPSTSPIDKEKLIASSTFCNLSSSSRSISSFITYSKAVTGTTASSKSHCAKQMEQTQCWR